MEDAELLLEAVKAGDAARVAALLEERPELAGAKSETGDSAVLLSLYHGRKEITPLLLARGPSLTIFEAAALGEIERAQACLKERPAQLQAYSHDGFTPLHLAAFFGHRRLAELLLDQGAPPNARSRNQTFARGSTPLHSAVSGRQLAIAERLLYRNAGANIRDADGGTPLYNAAALGDGDMVRLLLGQGADLNARHNNGQTPLAAAREHGHAAVADLLRQRGGTE